MQHYYDTVGIEDVDEYLQRTRSAQSQEAKILHHFQQHPNDYLTPFDVMKATGMTCINSVRRAMTNLTQKGQLRKTSVKVKGDYGHINRTWKLNSTNELPGLH